MGRSVLLLLESRRAEVPGRQVEEGRELGRKLYWGGRLLGLLYIGHMCVVHVWRIHVCRMHVAMFTCIEAQRGHRVSSSVVPCLSLGDSH